MNLGFVALCSAGTALVAFNLARGTRSSGRERREAWQRWWLEAARPYCIPRCATESDDIVSTAESGDIAYATGSDDIGAAYQAWSRRAIRTDHAGLRLVKAA